MPTTQAILERIFQYHGVKDVTPTDKNRSAYVLGADQVETLEAAGILPQQYVTFEVRVLLDGIRSVDASYYHSERVGSGRPPEPRMGGEFISGWLDVGDRLFLGAIGTSLFACKLLPGELTQDEEIALEQDIYHRVPDAELQRVVQSVPVRPQRRVVPEREEYVRSAAVIELAKRLSAGRCEMPGCDYEPFLTDARDPFLEVHHMIPLSEGGEDTIRNVAALCPTCHRAQHHSFDRVRLRETLQVAVRLSRG